MPFNRSSPTAADSLLSVRETVPAGEAAAEQISKSEKANAAGVEEVAADKGYHAGSTLEKLAEWGVLSDISEPKRGRRKWRGKAGQQTATYSNRRRVTGERGKDPLRSRGEKLKRRSRISSRRAG